MKRISILGSTGSIGKNSLDVVSRQKERYCIAYLTANRNLERLLEQAKRFHPKAVVIIDTNRVAEFKPQFQQIGVELLSGFEGLLEISARDDVDIVINALVGAVGLRPTLNAIKPGCRIALANKETLVLGGELVMARCKEQGAELVPIDSEHSALLQCLLGERTEDIEQLILTASGGPFRKKAVEEFREVTLGEALNHPNWNMGPKITIDSATLMNKGLEVIEAFWLFGLELSKINVVIHPQSIVHSLVEFVDGSVKAQLGLPDMRVPIQYALTYPKRLSATFPRLDLAEWQKLTFEAPDLEKFRCLKLAFAALEQGGVAPAILNASNEEAVNLFLSERIRFDQIPELVESALNSCETNSYHDIDDLLQYDQMARSHVIDKCKSSF